MLYNYFSLRDGSDLYYRGTRCISITTYDTYTIHVARTAARGGPVRTRTVDSVGRRRQIRGTGARERTSHTERSNFDVCP